MNTLVAIANSSSFMNPSNWLESPVQEFFSALNWEDLPPNIQQIGEVTPQYSDVTLSLNLSVSRFFAAINWEGAAIAAPVSAPSETTSADSFTLDDFSDLFG